MAEAAVKKKKKKSSSKKKGTAAKASPSWFSSNKSSSAGAKQEPSYLEQLSSTMGNSSIAKYLKGLFSSNDSSPFAKKAEAPAKGKGKGKGAKKKKLYVDNTKLGFMSAEFESNGDPGTVSKGTNDAGGKSYGSYQFRSKEPENIVKDFLNWVKDKDPAVYAVLDAGYQADGNTIKQEKDTNFDIAWRKIAAEQATHFLELQHDYTKIMYYDKSVQHIKSKYDVDVDARSWALQNVIWSRSVQHGPARLESVLKKAFNGMVPKDATDEQLIRAIYKESGKLKAATGTFTMEEKAAETYGVKGKSMAYYGNNPSDMQTGVYVRLNHSEPEKALKLLNGDNYQFTGL